MQAPQVTPEAVTKALKTVRTREELRGLYAPEDSAPAWWTWLKELFSGSSDSPSDYDPSQGLEGAHGLLEMAPYVVAGVVLLLVLVGVAVFVSRSSRKARNKQEESSERRARLVEELLAEGARAQSGGELAAALRAYWAALVTGLGRGAELVYRPAWTCREMLARSPGEGPDVELLARLLPRVEELEFGRAEIVAGDVDELARLCQERLS